MSKGFKLLFTIFMITVCIAGFIMCLKHGIFAAEGWAVAAMWVFAFHKMENTASSMHDMAKDAIDNVGRLANIFSRAKICAMYKVPIEADGEQERQDGQDSHKPDQQPDEPKPVEPTKEDNEYEDRVQVVRDLAKCSDEVLHYLTEGVDEFTCNSGGVEVKVCVKHDSGTSGQENEENENKEKK